MNKNKKYQNQKNKIQMKEIKNLCNLILQIYKLKR